MAITDIYNVKKMNISVEPVDENWEDTNNFVPNKIINIKTIGNIEGNTEGTGNKPIIKPAKPNHSGENKPVIEQPEVVEPVIVNPEVPAIANETVYEDAENGLNPNWITIKGQYTPQIKTPVYKNNSKAFVKLQNEWKSLGGELWENLSEYQLPMNNTTQKFIQMGKF